MRGTKQIGRTIDFSQDGFVYLADASDAAPVTSTAREPGSSTTTTASDTTTAPSTTTSVTTRSVTATTSEAPDPDLPTGTSLNETILAEGLGSLVNPDINLSAVARTTVEEQMYSGSAPLELEPSISLFPRLLDAHRTAWDGHVGFQADCRAKEAEDVLKKQRDDELSRVRRGLTVSSARAMMISGTGGTTNRVSSISTPAVVGRPVPRPILLTAPSLRTRRAR
nr:hypothetical protein [Rhodococcus wratislaviensis]